MIQGMVIFKLIISKGGIITSGRAPKIMRRVTKSGNL